MATNAPRRPHPASPSECAKSCGAITTYRTGELVRPSSTVLMRAVLVAVGILVSTFGCANGLVLAGNYALVAVGLTLVFGVMRMVNFAQGQSVMIGAFVAFTAARYVGYLPAIGIAMLITDRYVKLARVV